MLPATRHVARQAGFSLVEIMVGLVIGMISVLVMMQVFSAAEAYKRTITGGGDAQSNGAVALYALQRDIRHSGYGASSPMLVGCNLRLRAGVIVRNLVPLTINHPDIPAGDANTDTLLIVSGNANDSPEGDSIVLHPAAATYSVVTPTAFRSGDMVVARPPDRAAPCDLTMEPVFKVISPSPPNVIVSTGSASDVTNGRLFNLGQSPRILAYAIRNGNLTQCDYIVNDCAGVEQTGNQAVWVPVASGIVSLRAQYGTSAGGIVAFSHGAPAACSDWMQIKLARLALVARSQQYEKNAVTSAPPEWAGNDEAPLSLDSDPAWGHYRYRMFQTVVPIRNLLASGATACT